MWVGRQEHEPANILTGDSLFWEYRPDLIRQVLSFLTPHNMQVHYASSHFAAEAADWPEERYYGVKHHVSAFEPSMIEVCSLSGLSPACWEKRGV